MFDPKTNLTFEPPQQLTNMNWWPYPAIWSANEQRKGARSGVASWPQEAIRISKYQGYNRSRSFRDIVDQILLWFNDSIEPINFGAIYFHEPDLTGLDYPNIFAKFSIIFAFRSSNWTLFHEYDKDGSSV